MRVLSIDPGIVNLGWCVAVGEPRGTDMQIETYGSEDVTRSCYRPDCDLPRTRELWDRLEHAYAHVLEPHCTAVDRIVIERQPPGGLTEVVSFFYSKHRAKVNIVHPCSMHTFYGIGGHPYDDRKRCTEAIAAKWVTDLHCGDGRRVHDVADAVAFAWYFLCAVEPPPPTIPPPPHAWDAFRYHIATDRTPGS